MIRGGDVVGQEGGAAEGAGGERPVAVRPSEHPSVEALRERFGGALLRHEVQSGDEDVVFIAASRSLEVLAWLKDDAAQCYDLLLDVTAVDYGGGRPLQVVYQIYSTRTRRMLRVKVELPLDALEIESVAGLWAAADWLEREVYDLFGVRFAGHPDLRRILMPDNYAEGHPLRKDFPLRGRFTREEQTRLALALEVEDHYTPAELASAGTRRTGHALPDASMESDAAVSPAASGGPNGGGHGGAGV